MWKWFMLVAVGFFVGRITSDMSKNLVDRKEKSIEKIVVVAEQWRGLEVKPEMTLKNRLDRLDELRKFEIERKNPGSFDLESQPDLQDDNFKRWLDKK